MNDYYYKDVLVMNFTIKIHWPMIPIVKMCGILFFTVKMYQKLFLLEKYLGYDF